MKKQITREEIVALNGGSYAAADKVIQYHLRWKKLVAVVNDLESVYLLNEIEQKDLVFDPKWY